MTPYEIKLLLDIYTIPNWFENRSEPILGETLSKFENNDLIVYGLGLTNTKLTVKGRAHVSQLCNLPFPQELKQWVDFSGNHIPHI